MKVFVLCSENPDHKKGFKNLCNFAKEKTLKESGAAAPTSSLVDVAHELSTRGVFEELQALAVAISPSG